MDKLEFGIIQILERGIPLRAVEIARMLGVERREVNHYLYSSLKQQVSQDSDYRGTTIIGTENRNKPVMPINKGV